MFLNQWTIGNVITIVGMAIMASGIYAQLHSTIAVQQQMIVKLETTIKEKDARDQQLMSEMRSSVLEKESRVRALELGFGRIDEKMIGLSAQLTRIENYVKGN